MTTMMYQSQAAAFGAADLYRPHATNSTPTQPPTQHLDIPAACAQKKKVVANLPTKCVHCGKAFESGKNCLAELRDGDIMAYCRSSGGCGRSQVLFSSIPLTVPKYRQVCVFKADEEMEVAAEQSQQAGQVQFLQQDAPMAMPMAAGPPAANALDIYALHGIQRPTTVCQNCKQPYSQHQHGYDHNGWLQDGAVSVQLPPDWPTWQPSSQTWK
eukprot:TRINITY_DN851_c0_g1_i12.p1 TRINITY_DN851_c0_g1~~TRINITY_DN851_c0_g1_i12.p1  ORF type:complete len:213 (+),score=22.79 TRINITY_DN851_c0_g1_i12:626-1264(+)